VFINDVKVFHKKTVVITYPISKSNEAFNKVVQTCSG